MDSGSVRLERLHDFSEVKAALGLTSNLALKAACEKFGIPVIALSKQKKSLRTSDYDLLLRRAGGLD